MATHGDRDPHPKPLSELLDEVMPATDIKEDERLVDYHGAWDNTVPPPPASQPDPLEPAVRLEAARMACGSFGAAGCFDNEVLINRAEALFRYIKDGLE